MRETVQLSETESVSAPIVNAVGTVTETHPHDLPPLYQSVDVDSVKSLVTPSRNQFDADVTICLEMVGCTVTVSNDGTVTVTNEGRDVVDMQLSHTSTGYSQSGSGVASE